MHFNDLFRRSSKYEAQELQAFSRKKLYLSLKLTYKKIKKREFKKQFKVPENQKLSTH